ncbi:hypothetical protein B0H14DRAFT_2594411 [Mycena olivaceomarginata]|nr:hypothetical protein B0H14DRAFT_2594411 [Mycena olivaceomarginata]
MSVHMVGGWQIFLDTGRDMGQQYDSHLKSHLDAEGEDAKALTNERGIGSWCWRNARISFGWSELLIENGAACRSSCNGTNTPKGLRVEVNLGEMEGRDIKKDRPVDDGEAAEGCGGTPHIWHWSVQVEGRTIMSGKIEAKAR